MILAAIFVVIVFLVGFYARKPVQPVTQEQLRAETSL